MSHQPERREKNCLNCGTTVQGRFCHVCGQENIEPKETFWGLVQHFFEDLTHFDGKAFVTIKDLIAKPGFLSKEYMQGKRVRYLHPIRMYLLTSALFFLVFFYIINPTKFVKQGGPLTLTNEDRISLANSIKEEQKSRPGDTSLQRSLALVLDTTRPVRYEDISNINALHITLNNKKLKNYTTIAKYDSVQNALPAQKRDGLITRKVTEKTIEFNNKFKGNYKEGFKELSEIFLHKLPYLLFISLPFFALILKLLYIRRKNFYYSDHAVFTLHHYIVSFLILLAVFIVDALETRLHRSIFSVLAPFLFLLWGVYLFLEMKNFYGQGWVKTLGKFLLLLLSACIVLLVLLIIFLFFSFFQI